MADRIVKEVEDKKKGKRGESNYARKKKWLDRNGLWGFEVPHPKPWKKGVAK